MAKYSGIGCYLELPTEDFLASLLSLCLNRCFSFTFIDSYIILLGDHYMDSDLALRFAFLGFPLDILVEASRTLTLVLCLHTQHCWLTRSAIIELIWAYFYHACSYLWVACQLSFSNDFRLSGYLTVLKRLWYIKIFETNLDSNLYFYILEPMTDRALTIPEMSPRYRSYYFGRKHLTF